MRDNSWDVVKGVLISLVVIGHILQYIACSGVGFEANPMFKAIYMVHMPAFLFVSGRFSYKLKDGSMIRKTMMRACRMIYIMVIWSLLLVLFKDLFTSSSLGFRSMLGSISHEWWFLWGIVCSGCIVATLEMVGRYKYFVGILVLVAISFISQVWIIHMIKFSVVFYLIGYFSSLHWAAICKRKVALYSCSIILFGLAWILWDSGTYVYRSKMSIWSGEGLRTLVLLMGGVGGSFLLIFIARSTIAGKLGELLAIVGRQSLPIYMLQGCFFSVYSVGLNQGDFPVMNTRIFLLCFLLIAIMAGIVRSSYLRKLLLGEFYEMPKHA